MSATPRLRMFAGPNGSGKSTIKEVVPAELLGVYINPDEIEKELSNTGKLDFYNYQIQPPDAEVMNYLQHSQLLKSAGLTSELSHVRCINNTLDFSQTQVNSYFASVIASYIREKLLELKTSFTFETVMSSPDKVDFLAKARKCGFRTYLYFVATEDPRINISRVAHRVKVGGHPVPEEKIVSRYHRSLALLINAVSHSDRAYIFDNSGSERTWLAEITDGTELEFKSNLIPNWLKTALDISINK